MIAEHLAKHLRKRHTVELDVVHLYCREDSSRNIVGPRELIRDLRIAVRVDNKE